MFKIFKRLEFYIVLLGILVHIQMIWWLIFFNQNQNQYFRILTENDSLILKILNKESLDTLPAYIGYDKQKKIYYVSKEIYEIRKKEINRKRFMLVSEATFFLSVFIIISFLIFKFYNKQLILLKEKDLFFNSFTHDLKTPITAIKLNLQTLKKKIPKNKLIKKLVETCIYELEILNQKISRILYNKDIRVSIKTKNNFVNLKNIMETLIKEIRNEFNQKKIKIKVDYLFSQIENLELIIPSSWLYFVIREICTNAIKYSDEIVEIHIKVTSKKELFKKYIVISIRDNGWGIPENFIQSQNFILPFGRYHFSIKDHLQEGSGLGLYYIKEILKSTKSKMTLKNLERGLEVNLFLAKK